MRGTAVENRGRGVRWWSRTRPSAIDPRLDWVFAVGDECRPARLGGLGRRRLARAPWRADPHRPDREQRGSSQTRRRAVAAVLGLVLVALIAPAAAEATVSMSVDNTAKRLVISDQSGVNDSIAVSEGPNSRFDIESTQPVTRGTGCTGKSGETTPGRFGASCTGDIRGFLVTLGGGNDDWTDLHGTRLADAFPPTPIGVNGGPGNDVLRGGRDDDSLDGAEGDDQLMSGGGFDVLAGGAGADSLSDGDGPTTQTGDNFRGGPDSDKLLLKGGGDVADGEAGADIIFEEDALQVMDRIDGGTESDKWVAERSIGVTVADGATSTSVFRDPPFKSGAEFEETISNIESYEGTNEPDVMNAALSSAKGRSYDGRGGPDVLVGNDAANGITGGNGRDVLHGRDGDDTLDAKAGEGAAVPDQVIDCGAGISDTARIDLLDPDPTGCEVVARSAIGEGPHVRIGPARPLRGRAYAVKLRCPRKLKHRCKGTLEIALTARSLRRAKAKRYSIRAGGRRTVRVRLTRNDARRLRRLRRSRGFVRSLEKGDIAGEKTTLARRALKRS